MFRNKKGDMTINIIIGAAIAMVVLVLLILIFTGRINLMFGKTCEDSKGIWVEPEQCGAEGTDITCQIQGVFKDDRKSEGLVCCKDTANCSP